jgi:hypothetical protein
VRKSELVLWFRSLLEGPAPQQRRELLNHHTDEAAALSLRPIESYRQGGLPGRVALVDWVMLVGWGDGFSYRQDLQISSTDAFCNGVVVSGGGEDETRLARNLPNNALNI